MILHRSMDTPPGPHPPFPLSSPSLHTALKATWCASCISLGPFVLFFGLIRLLRDFLFLIYVCANELNTCLRFFSVDEQ